MDTEVLNSPNLELFLRLPGGGRLERSERHDGLPFAVRLRPGPAVAADLVISIPESALSQCESCESIAQYASIFEGVITLPLDLASLVEERLPAVSGTAPPRGGVGKNDEYDEQPGVAHFVFYRERAAGVAPVPPLHFTVVAPTAARDLRRLRFIFEQYTYFQQYLPDESNNLNDDSPQANLGSRGIESTGFFIRHGLQFGGRLAGSTIRALGKLYTDVATINQGDTPTTEREITPEVVETVERRRENARQFRDTARTLSSTLMYPVRWAGQQAAHLTEAESEPEPESLRRIASDTAGGISNAVTAVIKGVQEATGEIGNAIRDVAIEHAKRVNGEEYAQTVTATYLEAGADICRGALSAANVATLGSAGIIVGAAVESGDMFFNFYEYVVGPVLLQGFVYFTSIPAMRPTLKYAVLRPWSLCLYSSCAVLTDKPEKVIATSNLGALPRLDRIKMLQPNMIASSLDALHVDSIASRAWGCEALEFNSIDGTSYTMYASPSSEVPITEWLRELKEACARVETVSKPMSGARELRESRRLRVLPKTRQINALVRGIRLSLNAESKAAESQSIDVVVRSDAATSMSHSISSIFVAIVPLTAEGTELSDERKTSSSVSVADSIHGTDTLIIFSPLEAFEFGKISSLADHYRLRISVFGVGVSTAASGGGDAGEADPVPVLIGSTEISLSPQQPSRSPAALDLAVDGIGGAALDAVVSLVNV